MNELSKFIAENLFETKMSANGLDGWSNYVGHDYSGWLCGPAHNRDSDVLSRCNFEVALEMLGGESKTVEVRRVGHWACGWFEQIMVKCTALKKVQVLKEIHDALESYPVLDDDRFSEMEYEENNDTFDTHVNEFRREFFKFLDFKNCDLVGKNEKRLASIDCLLSRAFHDDCGYSGEGWITQDSLQRYFEGDGKWDLKHETGLIADILKKRFPLKAGEL